MSSDERVLVVEPEDLGRFVVEPSEPDAATAFPPGNVAIGSDVIRQVFNELFASGVKLTPGDPQPTLRVGDLALTSTRHDSGPVTAEVGRRQSDGTWRWVIDQGDSDAAGDFLTEKLGLLVKTNAVDGPESRLLSVVSPEALDGVNLLLNIPDDTVRAFHESLFAQHTPAVSFTTTDIDRDHATLVERASRSPSRQPCLATAAPTPCSRTAKANFSASTRICTSCPGVAVAGELQ